ncbi:site-specific integrase [Ruegeria sp. WL0004]|uniref:Site-specific integrase n=1 Tax=Ruegeria marisflavi TaxID=2984152 RepID=A0ABT2WXF9_9RHOB|nr:site-specific integrase [Ruegeria sp. WL0004]MCU9840570.1 site-specific integrase [Ruegeria sp. WL0004]
MANITERFTKRAEAPEKGNKIHYDDAIPGFGLRVTKAGSRSFVLNYTVNRRERRMTIGSYPAWSASAAREEAKRLRRMIDQGEDPLEERNQRKAAPNVGDLWIEYERIHLPTLSERSQTDQRGMWMKYILPDLQYVQVRELASRHVDRLHAHVSEAGQTRANRVLEVFRKALNLAIRWGWIEKNPADGFRRNSEHSRERYLTSAEYERVFDALNRMQNQKAANAIRLLILTGARRGEVLSLEWSDLDLERGIWNRPPHKSKDRKRKRIPLSNEALVLLRAMEENATDSYLFPTATGSHLPDLNRPWRWLKRETGLNDLRIHDLRHSFASVLISGGIPLEAIGKLLGHSQHQTTLRYAHLMDDPLRRAANSFSNISTNK